MFSPQKRLMVLPEDPVQRIQELVSQNQVQFVTISYLQSELDKAHERLRHAEGLLEFLLKQQNPGALISIK